MLFNLLLLILWAPALLGFGVTWRALVALPGEADTAEGYCPGILIIFSFVPLAIAATTLHFFVALGESVSAAILVTGYVLLIYHRKKLSKILSSRSLLGGLFVAALVCLFASRPLRHFDTGLYHIQSVRWCTSLPIVRGLANLHERLAFNSLWTPIAAVVDFPALVNKPCYPVTCLLLFGFGWAVWDAINWPTGKQNVPELFLATCGCFWSWLVTTNSHFVVLPSLSTDAPIYCTTLVCVYFLLRFCAENNLADFSHAIVLSAFAVTIKVSAVPLFLFLTVFGIYCLCRKRYVISLRSGLITVGTIGCLFLLWVARSVCLSGYLIFPVPATALAFLPWHLPIGMTNQLVDTLKAWARWPGVSPEIVLASSAWISMWLKHLEGTYVSYMIAGYGIFGSTLLLLARGLGRRSYDVARFWPAGAMLCLGIGYWFITVPDLRYGCAYLFGFSCLISAFGSSSLLKQDINRVLVGGAVLLPLLAVGELTQFHFRDLPDLEKGVASVQRTEQGTRILVAGEDERIWDGPLPSTPYFRPTLITRRDASGRIRQFELPEAIHTPYYDRLPAQVRAGLALQR